MRNHPLGVHLNLNVRGLKPSATVAINERSAELIRSGKSIHRLGLGQSPFPVPDDVVQMLKLHAHEKDYLPTRGLEQLREAVAGFHHRREGVSIDPENVLIGPGSKELMFLVQMAYYGDLVVPAPCWVSYAPQARIIGRHVYFVPTTFEQGWRLLPDEFDQLCREDSSRPRLVILNYPGNPDGNTYSETELQDLAAIAKRHEVVVISDEIYAQIHHTDKHVSIAKYYPEGTIISSGLSKWCGAGGWRIGTFAFPPTLTWLRNALAALASETYTSTSAPIQYAAVHAFRGSLYIERYLIHVRRILRALGNWCTARLREAGARLVEPQGAFYLFPDFEPIRDKLALRSIRNARQLCQRALDEVGVAFLPGDDFAMPATTLTARLAYVDFDGARALVASQTVPLEHELDEAFLREYCEPTLTGIDKLCDWLVA